MNFENYKNFVAIVDAGTISKASEQLLIAQPALTKQIQALEIAYGTTLLIRHPRSLELTDAGRILYDKLKTICYLEDTAQKEINDCILGNRGVLRLGKTPANPDVEMNELLLGYHEMHPGVNFEITERNSGVIIEQVQEGRLEVGLVHLDTKLPPDLKPVLYVEERISAYFHKEHPILRPELEEIPMELMQQCPISISQGLKDNYSTACEYHGFTASYMSISNSRTLSTFWAEDKKTVGIMIASEAADIGDYCIRPIQADFPHRVRAFVVSSDRKMSNVCRGFLEYMADILVLRGWVEEN